MTTRSSPIDGYRADIDGLRAVAVLAVIFFHLEKGLLAGGFVGVDIFFVISGFLITRNIILEIQRGRFSIIGFYRRRIKRIAPAMLVVVAATIVLAKVLMLPEDARATAKSAIWSLSSMANVYFWLYQDGGYFATDSANLPLLHLWSLGVEEQFYILWPALLLVFFRPVHFALFAFVGLSVAFGSFLLGAALFPIDPSFAYYMLPTRAGELLLGAVAAAAIVNRFDEKLPMRFLGALAVFGSMLIMASLIFLTEDHPFPGWFAIPPTLGAALLVFAGRCRPDHLIFRLLALKPMVAVGLISYSAYLWHWPLISFYHYGYGEIGPIAAIAIFLLTLLLARMTFRYIEQPARYSNAGAARIFLSQLVLPGAVVGILAIVLIYPARFGISVSSESYLARLKAIRNETRPPFQFDWVCQRQRIVSADIHNEHCVLGDPLAGPPRAILWGDSNAAHYVGMVEQFAKVSKFRFRNIEIGSCPPLDIDPTPFVEAKRERDCRESLQIVRSAVHDFPVVIISSAWSTYQEKSKDFLPSFFDTVDDLAAMGKLVILIGKAPVIAGYDRTCREKTLKYPFLECPNVAVPVSYDVANVNARLRTYAELHSNVRYFDATSYLCPDGQCRAYSVNGSPKYFDPNHLTMAASADLGMEILKKEGVPPMFSLISTWQSAKKVQSVADD